MKRLSAPTDRDRDSKRVVAIAGGAMAAIVFLALALIFTNSYGSQQVAANARALHWTNATLGSASIARASNAQAIVFTVDEQLGVADADAADRARAEARTNLANLQIWVGGWEAAFSDSDTASLLDDFAATGHQILASLDAGQVSEAVELSNGQAEKLYASLSIALGSAQQDITEEIDNTEALAGVVAAITRFLVTLLIPVGTILIYRWLVHRQAVSSNLALQVKLEAERKLRKARDEFIANISHEIRTPLTSIYGFSEVLIEEGLVDPEMAMELIGLINGESAELSRMVEDLLTAARLDANVLNFKFEAVSLADEIGTVSAPMIRSGAEVRIDVPRVMIWADQMRFRQIIRNLISNAIKHGGDHVTISGRSEGARFLLTVADDGAGVPEEIEDRIFERFIHEGSEPLLTGSVGLGLAIAKMLSDEMECELNYQRVDGETRFVLSLLRATEALSREPGFVEDSQATANSGSRRLGGVAASFAGNGGQKQGDGRGAEGSDTLAAGESRSGP
ncbi:MAG: HAMP domain-containing histidine kinase [Acidimicrobiia bacterium]|nr:HAMP domain-containing histidine kinase [Acidimicrobiia bacterium]